MGKGKIGGYSRSWGERTRKKLSRRREGGPRHMERGRKGFGEALRDGGFGLEETRAGQYPKAPDYTALGQKTGSRRGGVKRLRKGGGNI